MKKLILIISIERSGTNYFCNFIDNSFTNINVSYELFCKKECFINYNLKKNITDYYNTDIDKLYEKIKHNPINLLEKISEYCEENIILFKLFNWQLNNDNVKKIIECAYRVIFLKRNYIDTFISHEKAQKINKYENINTDNIKIFFDFQKFNKYKKINDIWFSDTYEHVNKCKINHIIINYEDFHMLSNSEKQIFLKSFFLDDDICMKDINHFVPLFIKQDNTSDYSDKIINYDDFVKSVGMDYNINS
jgi:hypothetical protein